MAALRMAFGLFFSTIALLGYMAFDYTMANRAIVAGGAEPIGFFQYVKGWTGLAGLLADAGEGAEDGDEPLPEALLAMLPKAPQGWTVRLAEATDAQPFLPPGTQPKDQELVLSAVTPNPGRGVDRVAQAYQNGPVLVVVELVRYPDLIFTSFMAMAEKMQLQMASLDVPGKEFMVVRGLEVREARLGADVPARVFLADVGGQIHLRVLAPRTMSDQDLLAFFETLHVPAMNADVVEKVAGLGEVPVIVLASVIDDETRKAREIELAAARKAADEAAQAEEARARAEADAAAAEDAADAGAAPVPEADSAAKAPEDDGVTVRKGLDKDNKGSTIETGTGTGFGGNCRTEGGRKVCGGSDE